MLLAEFLQAARDADCVFRVTLQGVVSANSGPWLRAQRRSGIRRSCRASLTAHSGHSLEEEMLHRSFPEPDIRGSVQHALTS